MAGSKYIDFICIAATIVSLFITALFMNGRALGIALITDGDSGDGQFTSNDRLTDWSGDDATQITLTGSGAAISGNGAYVNGSDVHIIYAGNYIVTGQLDNGSLIVDADRDDKIWIRMEQVRINCEDSAALLIEQAEKVFLTLADGTDNVFSSGTEYSQEAVSDGIDGTIYSRDDLTINGNGTLTVTSGYQHAIVCNDDLVITGGQISLEAPQDGIHANDSARIADAAVTITAGDDGITVSNEENTGYIYVESGNLTIPSCYEGLEASAVTIAGGTVDITSSDDGINASGNGSEALISITGGDIRIVNPNGRDADGLDSNGSISITGGNLLISVNGTGGNCALDCGTESGGECTVSGGTVIAAGGSSMAEGFDSSSQQCFIMHNTEAAVSEGTEITLKDQSGNILLSQTLPYGFSSLVLSSPGLELGDTCTLLIGDTETELTVDNSSAAAAFGMRHGMRGADMSSADMGGVDMGGGMRKPDMENSMDGSDMERRMRDPGRENGMGRSDMRNGMRPGGPMGRAMGPNAQTAQTPAANPKTLALAGISCLILLAGTVIAVKKKSLW